MNDYFFSSKVGQLAGNHFLTIIEGKDSLADLGKDVLWNGAHDIIFYMGNNCLKQ